MLSVALSRTVHIRVECSSVTYPGSSSRPLQKLLSHLGNSPAINPVPTSNRLVGPRCHHRNAATMLLWALSRCMATNSPRWSDVALDRSVASRNTIRLVALELSCSLRISTYDETLSIEHNYRGRVQNSAFNTASANPMKTTRVSATPKPE